MLQVRLLGQFQVRLDSQRVAIASRAAQSLFAYLSLTAGTPHRREKLAGMLWPEMTDANARNNLRHELWRLRKSLTIPGVDSPEFILAQEFSLAFNPDVEYWLDVAQLEKTGTELQSLISNLSLYRGELLPGFYDDWVSLERDRVQGIYETKMQLLLDSLLAENRWHSAIEWCERWIGLGQTPEPAYRALMTAHAELGDLNQLTADYARCAEALSREVGSEPSSETIALYTKLTGGVKPAASRAAPLPAVAVPTRQTTTLQKTAAAPGDPPFKGLEFFDVSDAHLYFGRETLVAKLADFLRQKRVVTAVLGASGSGKSSLVRAGMVLALQQLQTNHAEWREQPSLYIITPTAHPLEALAVTLTRNTESLTATTTFMDDMAQDPRSLHLHLKRLTSGIDRAPHELSRPLLLVIDQFEELFTLCSDELEREQFIDNLLYAVSSSSVHPPTSSGFTLVLALRADFYSHLASYPELRDLVAQHQEYIGPMTADELRRAIEEPAKQLRASDGMPWDLEPGLVDLMLRDMGEEPGTLPLLSHALLETWKRRRDHTLTFLGYHDSGGVRGAIAQTAETTYAELDPRAQEIARGIFVRLTQLGEGTEDTRRRATFAELVPRDADPAFVRTVLTHLADARLITTDRADRTALTEPQLGELGEPVNIFSETVEVAHEALIREWVRLRSWLNQDREGLRLHRQLTAAANEWELMERDTSVLYRGARLSQVQEYSSNNPNALNAQERAFLDASVENESREHKDKEAQRARELQAAQALAETQTRVAKQLRRRAIFLTAAFLIAALFAGVALLLGSQARSNAAIAQQKALESSIQQRIATSRELAAAAISNLSIDPERSILLALQAIAVTSVLDNTVLPEAENALHRAVIASRLQMTLTGHTDSVTSVVYSPDGNRLASASLDGTARVWDAATGKPLFTLLGHDSAVNDVAYSPDGKLIATASDDGTAKVWDSGSGQELFTLRGHTAGVYSNPNHVTSVTFSPDGTLVATGGFDRTVRFWDVSNGREVRGIFGLQGGPYSIDYSPDGTQIGASFDDEYPSVWGAAREGRIMILYRHYAGVRTLEYSSDGNRIITGDNTGVAKVWDAKTGDELLILIGHNTAVDRATYSPDGKRIATASIDGSAKIWDANSGTELFSLYGHSAGVNDVTFSPECTQQPDSPFPWCGSRVATASDDRTVKIWDVSPSGNRELVTLPGIAGTFNPDGQHFVTVSSLEPHQVRAQVWDIFATPARVSRTLDLSGHAERIQAVAFDTVAARIATGSIDNQAKVWDLPGGENSATFGFPRGTVSALAFSPDNRHLAVGGWDRAAVVWDIENGDELLSLSGGRPYVPGDREYFSNELGSRIAYSPDGKRIVSSESAEGVAQVWDVSTGAHKLTLRGHKFEIAAVTYSPDGKWIATGSYDGTAKLWDAATGTELLTLAGHLGAVQALAFSPDGTKLVTGSLDATAKMWDTATGEQLVTFSGQTKAITFIDFDATGTRLAVSSADGTVQVYLVRVRDLIDLAKKRLTRSWTPQECKTFLHVEQCPQPE